MAFKIHLFSNIFLFLACLLYVCSSPAPLLKIPFLATLAVLAEPHLYAAPALFDIPFPVQS